MSIFAHEYWKHIVFHSCQVEKSEAFFLFYDQHVWASKPLQRRRFCHLRHCCIFDRTKKTGSVLMYIIMLQFISQSATSCVTNKGQNSNLYLHAQKIAYGKHLF